MIDTGIIRRFDDLGRIGVPKEMRDNFGIVDKTPMHLYVEGNKIIMEKCEDTCLFCNSKENLQNINDRLICEKCLLTIMKGVSSNGVKRNSWKIRVGSINKELRAKKILKVGQLCKMKKSELAKLGFTTEKIKQIEIKLQLQGLDIKR